MPKCTPLELLARAFGAPLLALDVSARRIGLAISDPGRTMALPLETLRRGKWADDAAALIKIIRERQIGGLVIGLPLLADGSIGPAAQSRMTFARNLDVKLGEQGIEIPYILTDESLTTHAAREVLAGRGGAAGAEDQIAACQILEPFLEHREKK